MPVFNAVKSSPPGRFTGVPPALFKTSPPSPGIRIFNPFKSSKEFISLLNQPPICTPEFPAAIGIKLKGEYAFCQNSIPPPL